MSSDMRPDYALLLVINAKEMFAQSVFQDEKAYYTGALGEKVGTAAKSFATYQNAGVRAFDISDPFRPSEVAAFVPPAPGQMLDHCPNRPKVIPSRDVFVDADGLIYSNDYNAGLFILERSS